MAADTPTLLTSTLSAPHCTDGCAADLCGPTIASKAELRLQRWAWWLTALTIGWNSLEAGAAIVSGLLAGSVALLGFGLDSGIEVSSALIIAWRLSRQGTDPIANERAERRAVRLIALLFFALAAYITYDSATTLLGVSEHPEHSPIGLVVAALSLIVMPALAWAKRRVAAELRSVALTADAAETQLCAYLAALVLIGLAANALFGWWWMDPLAGLAVAALAVKEGREAWTSGELCDC